MSWGIIFTHPQEYFEANTFLATLREGGTGGGVGVSIYSSGE